MTNIATRNAEETAETMEETMEATMEAAEETMETIAEETIRKTAKATREETANGAEDAEIIAQAAPDPLALLTNLKTPTCTTSNPSNLKHCSTTTATLHFRSATRMIANWLFFLQMGFFELKDKRTSVLVQCCVLTTFIRKNALVNHDFERSSFFLNQKKLFTTRRGHPWTGYHRR